MENWVELFKDAPASKLYDEFDNFPPVYGNDNYFQEAIEKANNESKIKEIYTKVVGNLLNNSKLKVNRSFNKEYCTHFRFWLYGQIIEKFGHNSDNNKILGIINALFGGWHSFLSSSQDAQCSTMYSTTATLEEWARGKTFHDYFKNFNYIIENYSPSNGTCEKYHKYFQYINENYETYKHKCAENLMAPCDNYHTNIDQYNPNILLSKPPCETRSAYRVSIAGPSGEISEKMEMPPSQGTLDMEGVQDDGAPSVFVHNVVVASSSILGIFIFFFIFYRLTSLGYLLRSRFLSKKIMDNNIYEEEANTFLENTYEQENRIYGSSGHNIGYSPLKET